MARHQKLITLAVFVLGLFPLRLMAAEFDTAYADWGKVLADFVHARGSESRVDYAGLKAKPANLESFITAVQALEKDKFETWSAPEKLAFLINTYNAFTVKMAIDAYPIQSFKDIGGVFANPWRKLDKFKLFGDKIGLDRLEDDWLRKISAPFDARILFALSNASRGGPRLSAEPYRAATLDRQLNEAADLFVSDRTRNGYNPKTNTFEVSSLFNSKREDFVRAAGSVPKFLAARMKLEPPLTEVAIAKANVKYISYDWKLNSL